MRVCSKWLANPAIEWGDLATLAREMHVRKSLVNNPWEMDAFMSILRARRENVHVNFHCRACVTFKLCYKIASVPCKSADFSLQHGRACTYDGMCKYKGQGLTFTSSSTTKVILGQVFSIATCGSWIHRGVHASTLGCKKGFIKISRLLWSILLKRGRKADKPYDLYWVEISVVPPNRWDLGPSPGCYDSWKLSHNNKSQSF